MRKMVLLFLTVVLGLASVNSASAGFIAGANTKVALLATDYHVQGLVNKFTPPIPGPGSQMVHAGAGSFASSPASVYSDPFPPPILNGYNVYLVSVFSPNASDTTIPFGVTFTDGEIVKAVGTSNALGGLTGNVWGTHVGLKAQVKAALISFYGASSAIDTTVGEGLTDAQTLAGTTNVFGSGSQGVEIHLDAHPDTYFASLTSVNGTVDSTNFGGVNGLNELSLVFTAVPEPTSLGLFGIGTLVFGLARSRRKKS